MSTLSWVVIFGIGLAICGLVGVGNPEVEQTWVQSVVGIVFGIPTVVAALVLYGRYMEGKERMGEGGES